MDRCLIFHNHFQLTKILYTKLLHIGKWHIEILIVIVIHKPNNLILFLFRKLTTFHIWPKRF